jgi:D-alanyl-lipoteichoic acid acyltransferase DltB (MBOAT superfamily)
VAGPIERGNTLLQQLAQSRMVSGAGVESGLWLVIWGLFKKVVLADNLAYFVQPVFTDPGAGNPAVMAATIAFGLQIYCDFSGYCDVARGVARLLGFELMVNFNLPYSATSLREFWRRWHISLSTWLRDYLYVPLGGNRLGVSRTYVNLLGVMLLGGLWHGAALNFVLWGAWQGVGLAVNRWWEGHVSPGWRMPASLGWLLTLAFVFAGWLLFRVQSAEQLLGMIKALGRFSIPIWWTRYCLELALLASPLIAMQWWQWRTGDLEVAMRLGRWPRGALQALLLGAIALFWSGEQIPFIYFQF